MAKVGDEPEKHAESPPDPFENIADFSALGDYGCLTIAQCAIMASIVLLRGKVVDQHFETAHHYNALAYLDIADGRLNPRHPLTRIPYFEYERMIEAGMFGTDEAERPVLTSDWLIPLDEAERWLQSKDIPFSKDAGFNVDALRAAAADVRGEAEPTPAPIGDTVTVPASSVDDWKSQARRIADELFDKDTANGSRDSMFGYSYRVMAEMQSRGIKGPRGIIVNPNTVMREALQGGKWWKNKQK